MAHCALVNSNCALRIKVVDNDQGCYWRVGGGGRILPVRGRLRDPLPFWKGPFVINHVPGLAVKRVKTFAWGKGGTVSLLLKLVSE